VLLKQATLSGIRDGAITLAFRRWKRPTVKTGGTLLTSIGQLAIESVDVIGEGEITAAEAQAAGYASAEDLRSRLARTPKGDIYRVRLSLKGPDPRLALRAELPEADDLDAIVTRLSRMDARGALGPWTARVIELIRERPGVRAPDLAAECGIDRDPFKANVRKLKGLGLTESLSVGYRLSPRGEAVAVHLAKRT
jgi:hypothetical protein